MEPPIVSIYRDPLCLIVERLTDYTDLVNFIISQPRTRFNLIKSCVRQILTDRGKVNQYGVHPYYDIGIVFAFPNLNTIALPLRTSIERLQTLAFHPSLSIFEVTVLDTYNPSINSQILAFLRQYTEGTYDWNGMKYQNNRSLQAADIRLRNEQDSPLSFFVLGNAWLVDLHLNEEAAEVLERAGITDIWEYAEDPAYMYARGGLHVMFDLGYDESPSVVEQLRTSPNITRYYAHFYEGEKNYDLTQAEVLDEVIEFNMNRLRDSTESFGRLTVFTFPLRPSAQLTSIISKFPNVSRFVILLDSPDSSRDVPIAPRGKFFDYYFLYGGREIPVYGSSEELFHQEVWLY